MTDDLVFAPTFHATDDDSPFGSALCGYRPEGDEGIWVTQIKSDVNCVICRTFLQEN